MPPALTMRITAGLLICAAVFSAPFALARQPDAEQLEQKYNDALLQLKNAQDRKNELATENERLTTELAALKRQLAESEAKRLSAASKAAAEADKTFFYRSHYAAWTAFARRYPDIEQRWNDFYNSGGSIGVSEP